MAGARAPPVARRQHRVVSGLHVFVVCETPGARAARPEQAMGSRCLLPSASLRSSLMARPESWHVAWRCCTTGGCQRGGLAAVRGRGEGAPMGRWRRLRPSIGHRRDRSSKHSCGETACVGVGAEISSRGVNGRGTRRAQRQLGAAAAARGECASRGEEQHRGKEAVCCCGSDSSKGGTHATRQSQQGHRQQGRKRGSGGGSKGLLMILAAACSHTSGGGAPRHW